MKRFLRWMMVTCCLFVLIVWCGSYIFFAHLNGTNDRYSITVDVNWGSLDVCSENIHSSFGYAPTTWTRGIYAAEPVRSDTFNKFENWHVGGLVSYSLYGGVGSGLVVPLWLISIPIFLMTLWLWIPLAKSRRHGTHRKGFEVEMKKNESPSPQSRESMTPPANLNQNRPGEGVRDQSVKSV